MELGIYALTSEYISKCKYRKTQADKAKSGIDKSDWAKHISNEPQKYRKWGKQLWGYQPKLRTKARLSNKLSHLGAQ